MKTLLSIPLSITVFIRVLMINVFSSLTAANDSRPADITNAYEICNLPKSVSTPYYYPSGLHCCKCPDGEKVVKDCIKNKPNTTICEKMTETIKFTQTAVKSVFTSSPSNEVDANTKKLPPALTPNIFASNWKEMLLCISLTLNVVAILWIYQTKKIKKKLQEKRKENACLSSDRHFVKERDTWNGRTVTRRVMSVCDNL